jgi:hypothetical protein
MEDALPIKITSSASLLTRYIKLGSLVNKQEAQTNFQTLTAGWYEDEATITNIIITLVNHDEYIQQLTIDNCGDKTEISDDVILYVDNTFISCFIAVTTSEIELLDKQPKILSGYISMKVKKVINEIAEKLGLLTLPL